MLEIGNQLAEGTSSGRIATDQHKIHRRKLCVTRYTLQRRPEAAPGSVTHNGVPDFFSHRKSNASRRFLVCLQNLKNQTGCRNLTPAAGDPKKFGPFPELLSWLAKSDLGRKLLTALGATVVDDATATDGFHTSAEAMATLADELGRLISTLHGVIPQGND